MAARRLLGLALLCISVVVAQEEEEAGPLPSSWPHDYPGKPSGDYSPAWQNYFRVQNPVPGVPFPLSRSYAGNLPNGPIRIQSDGSLVKNRHSWDKLSDMFWIDQPVGVGYSTADADGYVPDQDQIGRDFIGFLGNLVKVFPALKTRPLVLAGESYAGMYIPYILKTYFATPNPPVQVSKILIGDGTITSGQVSNLLPTLSVVETFPQLIGYDPEVYLYLKEQHELCGYNIELHYPETGVLPDIPLIQPRDREIPYYASMTHHHKTFFTALKRRHLEESSRLQKRDREIRREAWKRDLSERVNGTIDPWYGCFTWDFVFDYALNYTYPWNEIEDMDVYDVPNALSPPPETDASPFLNDPAVRAALHAPASKDWALHFPFPFGSLGRIDPSPFPINFMTELATNATAQDIRIVLVSGNNDFLLPHLGTELAIQNTTFGGIQGFTRKPATPWTDDEGKFAGIVHQERGWTYALFYGAGHLIPANAPKAAYKFFREFVLGSNSLGKVIQTPGGGSGVIGGSDPALEGKNLPAGPEIYMGEGATQSTHVWPEATRAAWQSFILTETATTPAAAPTSTSSSRVRPTRRR
ncbi:hypothetical protein CC1G_00916 [Coprinopsis cinerea okayama7|uniref:Carboxypeptidase n=1 Tax=Coprinopsis cinerea (strain Okayama-7 / 130 / ATCC MYA-4618 / FGSC 9003) TaxID=240176 RepID=A8N941_COPC7|nr:hypothetical protein CC1G_00916 [Coprinopsis cinerea okayama7\|eukprot:XP_001831369.2 hypothetical protein CC1G_00916 [Coprinopsis cinerea okayama7\